MDVLCCRVRSVLDTFNGDNGQEIFNEVIQNKIFMLSFKVTSSLEKYNGNNEQKVFNDIITLLRSEKQQSDSLTEMYQRFHAFDQDVPHSCRKLLSKLLILCNTNKDIDLNVYNQFRELIVLRFYTRIVLQKQCGNIFTTNDVYTNNEQWLLDKAKLIYNTENTETEVAFIKNAKNYICEMCFKFLDTNIKICDRCNFTN